MLLNYPYDLHCQLLSNNITNITITTNIITYQPCLWFIVMNHYHWYHDSWCYNCYQSWPQNDPKCMVSDPDRDNNFWVHLYHMFDPYSFGSRWWVNDKSWYIYIYRGPEKDRKVISYSNSDRLLIYLFGILLISKSHNPSIMHQNLSSPVSERTKIKTREPSMSGPTSDGSKKNMENHWKITSFGNLRETIYKWVFPCQVWSVAWQSDTYEHLVQNLGHFSGLRSNPIWFTDSPFRS